MSNKQKTHNSQPKKEENSVGEQEKYQINRQHKRSQDLQKSVNKLRKLK